MITTTTPAVIVISDPLLTAEEVAAALRISVPNAYKIMDRVGAVKFGRSKRVRRSDLEQFIERNTRPGV